MGLKVFKIGGSLLNDIVGFKQIKKIVELHSNEITKEKNSIILVVSAFGKTTSKLLQTATIAELKGEIAAMPIINDIIQYHISIVDTLIKDKAKNTECKAYIQEQHTRLVNYIKGISLTHELSPRTKDLVLSIGELLASYIVSKVLSEYVQKMISFDITSVLITDKNYGGANPDLELTKKYIEATLIPLLKHCDVIVTQGFIGATINGEITTMGYESSNLTATIIAGLLKADEFVIWTDVEGIRQFDPKLTIDKKPKLINKINYDFAEYLGYSGLKLIYPKMIELLKQFDMEVTYKSGFEPEGECTIVCKKSDEYKCNVMLHSDNLVTYSKSDIMNKFDKNCFPALAHFLQHQNNIVWISPNDHLFVTDENIPVYVEEDLLAAQLHKKNKVSSLLLINFDYADFIDIMAKMEKKVKDQIINIFINYQRKTFNILYISSNDTDKKNILVKYFIDKFESANI